MDRSATTPSPPAPSAAAGPGDDAVVYADLLRDLREALQDPPEFVFRAGAPPHSRMAA